MGNLEEINRYLEKFNLTRLGLENPTDRGV